MAFLPHANRLPVDTHFHSQLDGPNVMDFVQEFDDKSESDKLKVQMIIMKMSLIRYGNTEVSQLCVTWVEDQNICLEHWGSVKFVHSSSEVVKEHNRLFEKSRGSSLSVWPYIKVLSSTLGPEEKDLVQLIFTQCDNPQMRPTLIQVRERKVSLKSVPVSCALQLTRKRYLEHRIMQGK